MSDSVTKWHEMQQDKELKVFESPDGGDTVTVRPFGGDIKDREVVTKAEVNREKAEFKKKAYRLLVEYDEDIILMAAKIINRNE
jgi:hypothetical protein|tara:strand:- start:45 stop:296 length:252 start_codon:yes stop_codon:yes gene_type:complete